MQKYGTQISQNYMADSGIYVRENGTNIEKHNT
jgi:hypothetical protein